MFFSVELLDLLMYCVQQLGIMLAVGAETIVLISYIAAYRDGVVTEPEARFSRAVHRALAVGILCIVGSGIVITVVHGSMGELSTIFQPVFLFKWALILGLVCAYIWQRGKPFSHYIVEGIIGGTWYALFLVHILAPVTSWANLITLYVIMLAGFVGIWSAAVMFTRNREHPAVKPTPRTPLPPTVKPQQQPQVVINVTQAAASKPAAAAQVAPVVQAPIPAKPIINPAPVAAAAPVVINVPPAPVAQRALEPHYSPWLPAIHVMPKSQEHLDTNKHITTLAALTKHA